MYAYIYYVYACAKSHFVPLKNYKSHNTDINKYEINLTGLFDSPFKDWTGRTGRNRKRKKLSCYSYLQRRKFFNA